MAKNTLIENCKILICTHAYPPDSGGIAAFTRDIYQLLKNAGSKVTVFKGDTKSRIGSRFKSYMDIVKMFGRLLLTLYKKKPDVVFCSRLLPLGPLALVWKPIFDYKLIVQVHGTELRSRYKEGWRKKILTELYNKADQLWANSQYTANLLEEYGCERNSIKIIYPFITRDAQKLAARVNGESKSDTFTLMTAAALYPRKGIDLVLKALSELKDLDWEYRIAGEPFNSHYEGMYERISQQLGIADRVKFMGQLDRSSLWKEMAHADLFVMPSRGFEDDIESFGIVFIEAQLFGVPCIGTDVGGIKEAIGDGGIIIKDEDIKELTESISYLINHREERNRLSDRSLKRVNKKFVEQSRYNDIENALAVLEGKPQES